VLTDNAQTFGVILLTGRPQNFYDRIDKGDSAWNDTLTKPAGVVKYMLSNRNPDTGDLITERYPNADRGTEEGLTPIFRTERYLLVKVAGKPAATESTTDESTSTTPNSSTTTTTTPSTGGVSSP
jgi:hypothetical protein